MPPPARTIFRAHRWVKRWSPATGRKRACFRSSREVHHDPQRRCDRRRKRQNGESRKFEAAGRHDHFPHTCRRSGKNISWMAATVIYLAIDDTLAGYIVLSDTVRQESPEMIRRIHVLGVQPVLLTGDHQNAAPMSLENSWASARSTQTCLPEGQAQPDRSLPKTWKRCLHDRVTGSMTHRR